MNVNGLEHFCAKHGVKVKDGDEFSLVDFVIDLAGQAVHLADIRGRISEKISSLDKDSDDWGGCPRCGSNVHSELSECPVCGLNLEDEANGEEAEEEPVKEKTALAPSTAPANGKPNRRGAEAVKTLPEKSQDDFDELVELDGDSDDAEDVEETEDEEDVEEDELEDDEAEDEDASEETDVLAVLEREDQPAPKPKAKKKNPSMTPEKTREKALRRERLRKVLPKLIANPHMSLKLKYEDLLMLPGLLDYSKRPTTLGNKEKIQSWVFATLKRRSSQMQDEAARRK